MTEPMETPERESSVAAPDSLEPPVWEVLFVPKKGAGKNEIISPRRKQAVSSRQVAVWAFASR